MSQDRSSLIVLSVFALAIIFMVFALNNGATTRFENSAIGTRGLAHWLDENGIEVEHANRQTSLAEEDVSLRILPLYDTDLNDWLYYTNRRDQNDPEASQIQTHRSVVETKITSTPTLLVLPKWLDRAAELDLLDEQLQYRTTIATRPLAQLNTPQLKLREPQTKLLEENGYVLYRPQLFAVDTVSDGCRSHVQLAGDVLIAECKTLGDLPFFILSDPDVLNNHGLALGENAAIALDLIAELAEGSDGTIFIDTSSRRILRRDIDTQAPAEPRTADDLARFFTYPFNLIFISAGITFLILTWRGLIRFGPAKRLDTGGVEASKTASIDAKSYLLRLAGEDHALLISYVSDKMNALARDLMGQKSTMDQAQFIKRLRKIAPSNAPTLETAIGDLSQTGPDTPTAELTRLIETFEHTYRRLRDELGHVSRNG